MAGQPHKLDNTDTRYVSADVTQGQLVMVDTAATDQFGKAKVRPATANSKGVLGVARLSASTAPSADTTFVKPRNKTTVFRKGPMYVTYTAACDEGVDLVAGANGAVTPYTSGTSTFDQIIGRSSQKVAAAGEGLAYIDC